MGSGGGGSSPGQKLAKDVVESQREATKSLKQGTSDVKGSVSPNINTVIQDLKRAYDAEGNEGYYKAILDPETGFAATMENTLQGARDTISNMDYSLVNRPAFTEFSDSVQQSGRTYLQGLGMVGEGVNRTYASTLGGPLEQGSKIDNSVFNLNKNMDAIKMAYIQPNASIAANYAGQVNFDEAPKVRMAGLMKTANKGYGNKYMTPNPDNFNFNFG